MRFRCRTVCGLIPRPHAGESVEAVNDDLIDSVLTDEHKQTLQGRTVQRRAGFPVVAPLIDNRPSQEALGFDE